MSFGMCNLVYISQPATYLNNEDVEEMAFIRIIREITNKKVN